MCSESHGGVQKASQAQLDVCNERAYSELSLLGGLSTFDPEGTDLFGTGLDKIMFVL